MSLSLSRVATLAVTCLVLATMLVPGARALAQDDPSKIFNFAPANSKGKKGKGKVKEEREKKKKAKKLHLNSTLQHQKNQTHTDTRSLFLALGRAAQVSHLSADFLNKR